MTFGLLFKMDTWNERFKSKTLLLVFVFLNLTVWLFDFIVSQNGMGSLFAGLLHHCLDPQVVDIESGDAHIDGWVDGMVCGLARFRPIPWL